jgi:hypothetical protein
MFTAAASPAQHHETVFGWQHPVHQVGGFHIAGPKGQNSPCRGHEAPVFATHMPFQARRADTRPAWQGALSPFRQAPGGPHRVEALATIFDSVSALWA